MLFCKQLLKKIFFIINLQLEKKDVGAKKFRVYFKKQIEIYIKEKDFQQHLNPHFHQNHVRALLYSQRD